MGTDVRRPLTDSRTPGPGNYNLPDRMVEGPKFSMKGAN